jgi:hypothetical protein
VDTVRCAHWGCCPLRKPTAAADSCLEILRLKRARRAARRVP